MVLAGLVPFVLAISAAAFAQVPPAVAADIRRGFAAVKAGASDEPALRAEQGASEPYRLGAALAAWTNAAAALKYIMENPSGDGNDSDAIDLACYDEKRAFGHLEAGRQAVGLPEAAVADAVNVQDAGLPTAWLVRRPGPIARCR